MTKALTVAELLKLPAARSWDTLRRQPADSPLRKEFPTKAKWLAHHRAETTVSRELTKIVKPQYDPITVDFPFESWQCDLFFVGKTANKVLNAQRDIILVCVDSYSRYVWIEPIINKTAVEVRDAFRRIFERVVIPGTNDPELPRKIITDDGSEFNNKILKAELDSRGIEHIVQSFTTDTVALNRHHVPLAENFHKELRRMIYEEVKDGGKWLPTIQSRVDIRNRAYSSGVMGIPEELLAGKEYDDRYKEKIEGRKLKQLPLGTKVRVQIQPRKFEKVVQRWSDRIHEITAYSGLKYILDNDPDRIYFRRELLVSKQ